MDDALIDNSPPTTMREFELIRELRRTVGLFDGAMPVSPKAAWDEAIRKVERLQRLLDDLSTAMRIVERK